MLELTSDPGNVTKVEQFVNDIVNRYCLSADTHGNLLITLTEAVNNAIIHGNCCDCSKKVRISTHKKKDLLAVRVSDQGCGFDFRRVPDPTRDENLDKIGGRGVFIMQQLADKLAYRDNGSTVEMMFKL